jgi:hypothetical protein
MPRPRCKGCRAPLRWIKARTGQAIAADPLRLTEWVTDTATGDQPWIMLIPGYGREVQTGWLASMATPGARRIEGYTSHVATCPAVTGIRPGGAQGRPTRDHSPGP